MVGYVVSFDEIRGTQLFLGGGFSSKHFNVILEEIHHASEVNIYSRLWLWFENI